MNLVTPFRPKLATALLALTLCTTDAAAMSWFTGMCRKQQSTTVTATSSSASATSDDTKKMIVCEKPLVRKGKDLQNLLYDVLDPMPLDLILIIIGYDHHKLKGTCVHEIKGDKLTGLAVLSDQHIITAHDANKNDESIRIWDPLTGQNITTLKERGDFRCLTPLAEGRIAAIYNSNFIVILNPQAEQTARWQKILRDDQTGATTIVSLNKLTNGLLVSGDRARNIKIWDPKAKHTNPCLYTLTGSGGDVRCLSQCASNLLISGSSYPGDIKAWNLSKSENQCTQTCGLSKDAKLCSVNCLAILSNDCVAVGTDIGTIVIWDPLTNANKIFDSATFTDEKKATPYSSIIVLSNGYLAAGTLHGIIHIIDPLTGELMAQLKHYESTKDDDMPVNFLCTLSNGWLVSGSMNGIFKIWR